MRSGTKRDPHFYEFGVFDLKRDPVCFDRDTVTEVRRVRTSLRLSLFCKLYTISGVRCIRTLSRSTLFSMSLNQMSSVGSNSKEIQFIFRGDTIRGTRTSACSNPKKIQSVSTETQPKEFSRFESKESMFSDRLPEESRGVELQRYSVCFR